LHFVPSTDVKQELITRRTTLGLFTDLESESGLSLRIRTVPPGTELDNGWDWLPRSATASGTGLVLVNGTVRPEPELPMLAIAPPFPCVEQGEWDNFRPIERELSIPRTVAIILLRLGHYAFGVAEDEHLALSKTGGRYVKNRQRKGGQSAMRFQRNREKWIQELFNEVQDVAGSRIRDYGTHIDWLAFGGDRNVLNQFKKRLVLPDDLQTRTLPWLLPVERPGRKELDRAVTSAWSCRVWRRPGSL
jgi:peptide subunit release factor 1 (eRF1)